MRKIVCLVLFFYHCNGQDNHPTEMDSFSKATEISTAVFGQTNTNATDYSVDKFLNPLRNDSASFQEKFTGPEDKINIQNGNFNSNFDKNNLNENIKSDNNSNAQVEIKPLEVPQQFTVSPIESNQSTGLSQNFFVSGNTNNSDLILTNLGNNSDKEQLHSNPSLFDDPVPDKPSSSGFIPAFNDFKISTSTLPNFQPSFFKNPSLSNNLSSDSINNQQTDISSTDRQISSSTSNQFEPPKSDEIISLIKSPADEKLMHSSNFTFTESPVNANDAMSVPPVVSSWKESGFSNGQESEIPKNVTPNEFTHQEMKPIDLQTTTINQPFMQTTTTNQPFTPVFGNPTPNGWIPQTIPPFFSERLNQDNSKLSEPIKNVGENASDFQGALNIHNISLDLNENLPTNTTHNAFTNVNIVEQPQIVHHDNKTDLKDSLPSSISDQAISQQNSPFPQKTGLTLPGIPSNVYNSSVISSSGNETLLEIIKDLGATTFLNYVEQTGLTSILKEKMCTVFVPTNKAFEVLAATLKEDLLRNLERLNVVLKYHIAEAFVVSGDFQNELMIPSLINGKDIRINLYSINETQVVTASGSPISATNKFATNGVVHILDKVMFGTPDFNLVGAVTSLPQFTRLSSLITASNFQQVLAGGPYTFFAPTELAFQKLPEGFLTNVMKNTSELLDILGCHLVSGTYYTEGLSGGATLRSINNKTVAISQTLGFFKVNNVDITTEKDITVTNGVLHSINTLLLPPNYSLNK